MKRTVVGTCVVASAIGLSCASRVDSASCTASPPVTYSRSQCDAWGALAECETTEHSSTSIPDGGASTSCHFSNCERTPACVPAT